MGGNRFISDGVKMIVVDSISKRIKDKIIYSNISLSCPASCSYLLVGANGVGKTSLLKTIIGLYKYDSGLVSICGRQVGGNFIAPGNVGVFFDTARMLPHNVVKESILFYASLYGKNHSDVGPLIKVLHLEDEIEKKFINLSTGNKRKVSLLISLINNPDLLIWDEPFASLDPEMCRELSELIKSLRAQGKTFLISTNDLYYGEEIYDKIGFFLNSKTIVEKSKQDLAERYPGKSLHDVYFLIKSEAEENQ